LHHFIFHIGLFRSRLERRQIGLARVLLLVFFLIPVTLVRAEDNVAGNQKVQPKMEDDPYVSPTNGLGPWIWEKKVLDNQTCQLWNTFGIPKGAKVTKAQLVMTVDIEVTLYFDGHEMGRKPRGALIMEVA
jgi:hypothetical protein